jgi:hypothetical protein
MDVPAAMATHSVYAYGSLFWFVGWVIAAGNGEALTMEAH